MVATGSKNIQESRSFLGLLNYYTKFIPKLLHPLNDLLRKDHKWQWTKQCSEDFSGAKTSAHLAIQLAGYSYEI